VELTRHRTTVTLDARGPAGSEASAAIDVALSATVSGFAWRIVNTSSRPVAVRRVAAVHTLRDLRGRVRLLRHGYQSWTPTAVAEVGTDRDPAPAANLELMVMSHHADQERPPAEQLRSELVTVLADDDDAVLVGFLGGDLHDGTIRVGRGPTGTEVSVEAFLGGAVLAPGEERLLHEVLVVPTSDPVGELDRWAAECGRRSAARTRAPYQVGWCSWYHYFEHVTERSYRENLAAAGDWPFDVFQLDDGFQSAIGDWTTTDDTFPSGLAAVADATAAAGMRPGVWLAPFLAAPDSVVARQHPDWIARFDDGEPLIGMYNDHWGGFVHTLDTSHPAVLDHLERVARDLVDAGFTYLKLDFTYAPGFDGRFHDPSMTPAQRVRAGYDAIRRGAGEGSFILGCGAPIGACIGVVDGMRIGPDVAPWWAPKPELWPFPGYEGTIPATMNAWRNTLGRAHQHRRLWLNDPDCLMLRTTDTDLTEEQVRAWAMAVAVSGGMAIVSDDLALLGEPARRLLDEVIEIGRAADAAATGGPAPRCEDLLSVDPPTTLVAAGVQLVGDPAAGTARVVR
jgi:alpha-galactosidase